MLVIINSWGGGKGVSASWSWGVHGLVSPKVNPKLSPKVNSKLSPKVGPKSSPWSSPESILQVSHCPTYTPTVSMVDAH